MSLSPLTITAVRLLPAFSFWLFTSLFHLKFSLFLVNPLETIWGTVKLKHYAPQAGYFLLFCMLCYLIWYFFNGRNRQNFYIWIIWLASIVVINRFLLATSIENIHFVQYAIITLLLIWGLERRHLDTSHLIPRVLFWITFAGIVDELMQYFWITASYSKYIDFNDFLLNLMGGIAGILIYTGYKTLPVSTFSIKKTLSSWEFRAFAVFLLLIGVFYHLGRIKFSAPHSIAAGSFDRTSNHMTVFFERAPNILGNWQNAFNGGEYYVLSPLEGILLLLLTGIAFSIFTARTQFR